MNQIKKTRLDKNFFQRNSVDVAKDLLGKTLVVGDYSGFITETEAYRGSDDPASHAFGGPTKRCKVMFGSPGVSYIYLIYGMYYCLNIVTEPEGNPGAVLIRGIDLLTPMQRKIDGPGRTCGALNLNKEYHGIDMTEHESFCVLDDYNVIKFESLMRVGIARGQDKLWRFRVIN